MFCKHCGTKCDDTAQYCPNCRNPLSSGSEDPRKIAMEMHRQMEEERKQAELEAKKKKRKKRLITWGILIVVLLFLLSMCSKACEAAFGESEEGTKDGGTSKAGAVETVAGQVEDYILTVKDSVLCKDESTGQDILVVTYSFTNNSESSQACMYALAIKAYQNGVELGDVWSNWGIENYYTDVDSTSREIQPGVTMDVQEAYELSDLETPVEITVEPWITFDNAPTVKYTVEIAG